MRTLIKSKVGFVKAFKSEEEKEQSYNEENGRNIK